MVLVSISSTRHVLAQFRQNRTDTSEYNTFPHRPQLAKTKRCQNSERHCHKNIFNKKCMGNHAVSPRGKQIQIHAPVSGTGFSGKKSNLYHHKYINRKKYTKKPDGCFFSILFFKKYNCYNQPKYHNNQCPWHILKWLPHICQNLFYNFTPHKFYYSHGSKKIQVYFFISM